MGSSAWRASRSEAGTHRGAHNRSQPGTAPASEFSSAQAHSAHRRQSPLHLQGPRRTLGPLSPAFCVVTILVPQLDTYFGKHMAYIMPLQILTPLPGGNCYDIHFPNQGTEARGGLPQAGDPEPTLRTITLHHLHAQRLRGGPPLSPLQRPLSLSELPQPPQPAEWNTVPLVRLPLPHGLAHSQLLLPTPTGSQTGVTKLGVLPRPWSQIPLRIGPRCPLLSLLGGQHLKPPLSVRLTPSSREGFSNKAPPWSPPRAVPYGPGLPPPGSGHVCVWATHSCCSFSGWEQCHPDRRGPAMLHPTHSGGPGKIHLQQPGTRHGPLHRANHCHPTRCTLTHARARRALDAHRAGFKSWLHHCLDLALLSLVLSFPTYKTEEGTPSLRGPPDLTCWACKRAEPSDTRTPCPAQGSPAGWWDKGPEA